MLLEETLISIPIYRCSPDKFNQENDREREKIYKSFYDANVDLIENEGYDIDPIVDRSMDRNFYVWEYNEIVGFIKIVFWSNQIRAILYLAEAKRFRRGFKKRKIIRKSKLFQIETHYHYKKTNKEIFNSLIVTLKSLSKNYDCIKNRHLDLSEFEKIGPCIKWHDLIKNK